jgi:hypothetical protein
LPLYPQLYPQMVRCYPGPLRLLAQMLRLAA